MPLLKNIIKNEIYGQRKQYGYDNGKGELKNGYFELFLFKQKEKNDQQSDNDTYPDGSKHKCGHKYDNCQKGKP